MTIKPIAHRLDHMGMAFVASLLLVAAVAACADQLGPGDTLSGHWFNADARLDASPDSVVFVARCQRATFGPIVLDGNRAFEAESASFLEIGNLNFPPGDQLRIQGTVTDGHLNLTVLVIRTSPPIPDPIAMMLRSGKSSDSLVCNA